MKSSIKNTISTFGGYKCDSYVWQKCDGCGCMFKVYPQEYVYRLPIKVSYATKYMKFHSYNCRSKWKKEHAKELEKQKESWY